MKDIAFAEREIIDTMERHSVRIDMIRVFGGGAKSKLWRQIKADVYGKPVAVPGMAEGVSLER